VADLAEQSGKRAAEEEQCKNCGNGDQRQDESVLGKALAIPTLDTSQEAHGRDSDKTGGATMRGINE
jgi:hypothetical protein